jgi:aryl-alcohol dehydrogenase-like predicted oxidoreductase
LPELLKLQHEGKIRATGITEGFLADPGHSTLRAATAEATFDTVMVGLNLRNPSAVATVLPIAADADLGVIGMFVLRGLFGSPGDARFDDIDRISAETGMTLSELSICWCRHQPGMSAVLTGTGDPVHLRQNIAAALAPPLAAAVLDRLNMLAYPERASIR